MHVHEATVQKLGIASFLENNKAIAQAVTAEQELVEGSVCLFILMG